MPRRELKPFGETLRSLREDAGLSREQLAKTAKMSRESVRLYEAGERDPTWKAVQFLAKALGVTTDTFRDQ